MHEAPRLMDYHFRLVKSRGKAPNFLHNLKSTDNCRVAKEKVDEILSSGLNYGFTCPSGFCCFVDADTFAWTFLYSTGTIGHYHYAYFIEDEPIGYIPLYGGACIKGKGGFAVGPGPIHPNSYIYGKETEYAKVAVLKKSELMRCLKDFGIYNSNLSTVAWTTSTGNGLNDVENIIRVLEPYWAAADGMRDEFMLAVAGLVARA